MIMEGDMKIIIILLFLVSCGKVNDMRAMDGELVHKSEPIFNTLARKFENEFNVAVKVPIIFSTTLERNIAGVCLVYSTGYREIQISRQVWFNQSEEQREQLVYHELGHCVLNKGHDDTTMGECPNSIMRSISFNDWEIDNCYIPDYNHYMEDLRK
jgi:SprT-like family